jgi:lipid-binding SYLF domain-containing protein
MRTSIHTLAAFIVAAFVLGGCGTTPKSEEKKQDLVAASQRQLDAMTAKNSNLQAEVDKAHGYAIFPKVGKGGLIAGGAYGRGVVYEQDRMIGYADLTQATIGLQAGGQAYSELILFQNKEALDRFRQNQVEVTANASAVIIQSGAGAAARYENGVAIYVMPRGGAMAEASVGGQKFTYVPSDETGTTRPTTRTAS